MPSSDKPAQQPLLRIKNFHPWRTLLAFAILAGGTALTIAGGSWDLTLIMAVGFVLVAVDLLRRAEWRGRSLVGNFGSPSAFEEGWRAVPRDLFTLTFIIVANVVNMLVLALIIGTSPTWFIGVGLAVVISMAASIMLIREIRRRSRSDEAT